MPDSRTEFPQKNYFKPLGVSDVIQKFRLITNIYILMPYSCPTCQLILFMRLYSTFITLFANTRVGQCNFFKYSSIISHIVLCYFFQFFSAKYKKKRSFLIIFMILSILPLANYHRKKFLLLKSKHFNSLHPNINMHILHTVLYTFLKARTRRICLTVAGFCNCGSFPQFS